MENTQPIITKPFFIKFLFFFAVLITAISCAQSHAPLPTIDISLEPNGPMKNIVLNVNMEKDSQLFHVEPIIKDSIPGKVVVGLVAVIGEVVEKQINEKDWISGIVFNLVHEKDSRAALSIKSCVIKDKTDYNYDGTEILIVNTTREEYVMPTIDTLWFDRQLKPEYKGDIEFQIDGKPNNHFGNPRICQFILL